MAVFGTVHNGEVKLDGPSPFPDGTKVRIESVENGWLTAELLEFVRKPPTGERFSDGLEEFIGAFPDLPEDAAENHDDYLTGRKPI